MDLSPAKMIERLSEIAAKIRDQIHERHVALIQIDIAAAVQTAEREATITHHMTMLQAETAAVDAIEKKIAVLQQGK